MKIFFSKSAARLVCLGCLGCLILFVTVGSQTAWAETEQEKLTRERGVNESTARNAEEQLRSINQELSRLHAAARTNQTRLASAQLELKKAVQEVNISEAKVTLARREVDRLSGEITRADREIRQSQKYLSARAVALMKMSRIENLEFLLTAEDAADLELHDRFLSLIATDDVGRIERTVDQKKNLETLKTSKVTILADLVSEERALAAARNNVTIRRNELQNVQNELGRATASKEEARRKTLAMINAIRSRLNSIQSRLDALSHIYTDPTVFNKPSAGPYFHPEGVSIPGIYIRAAQGSSVKAMAEGEVLSIQNMHGMGQTLILGHGGKLTSVYANLSSVGASVGQKLRRGQEIGRSGISPYGDMVYFAVYRGGVAQEPTRYLN